MSNAGMRALTLTRGLVVHTARLRPVIGTAVGSIPQRGAPTRWNEITGISVRHHY